MQNFYLTLVYFSAGIKVVLDLVPNHTSNESVWFQEALKGHEKYYNYFIWEDGVIDENGDRQPPNNWVRINQTDYNIYSLKKKITRVYIMTIIYNIFYYS